MKKLFSLIKVSLNHDMNIFKINSKKVGKFSKMILPIILTAYLMFVMGMYSKMLIEPLSEVHLEFVVLTLFGLVVSIISLLEGIYKSGPLIFNCKDDDLLLSLPIKRSTVLFIRIFKFYTFELIYNSLFILPSMIVYAYHMNPGLTYYLSSFLALLLLPILPIILSCIIGFVTTFLSSRVNSKHIFQTVFSFILIFLCMYVSYGMEGFVNNIAASASSLNEVITRVYYPVGAYISLVNNFDIMTFFIYLGTHLIVFALIVWILSKVYFNINSSIKKEVTTKHKKSNYVIKTSKKVPSFIHKELSKFFSTPVFIMNAGFGLVLFLLACVLAVIKFDNIAVSIIKENPEITLDTIKNILPLIMFGLVSFSSLMTSITSSMISLEGKSFNILKSLPLKPIEIVLYKVLTALVIIIPCILLGDIIIFIKFKFDIISIILILIATFLIPLISELIGIIMNLKYPKMDATNDTEVVKQSMSSMVSTFIGMGLVGVSVVVLFGLLTAGLSNHVIMLLALGIYSLICLGLWHILKKNCDKEFNNITI